MGRPRRVYKTAGKATEKRCGRCKKTKGAAEFGVAASQPDGLQAYCYACAKEYRRQRAAENLKVHLPRMQPLPVRTPPPPREDTAGPAREAQAILEGHASARMEDQQMLTVAGLPKMPRTTELTPAVQERICQALECGNTMRAACNVAGVNVRTFEGWLALGQQRNADPRMVALADAVEGAEAWGEALLVGTIRTDATINATSAKWLLERRYSKGKEAWIRPERIEHVGADGEALVEAGVVRAQILEKISKLEEARALKKRRENQKNEDEQGASSQ